MEEKNIGALQRARYKFKNGDPYMMADCSAANYESRGEGKGVFKLRYLNHDYLVTFPEGEISFADEEKETKLEIEKKGCGRPIQQDENYEGKFYESRVDYSGDTILISDQVIILYYLKKASGLPAKGRWINFLELPHGGHHHSCFVEDAINPMVEKLAGKKEKFYRGVEALGGQKSEMGDYGAIIPVFPKIDQAFIIWEGDEEFLPNGNVLFDAVISTYLDTASIYVMGINATMRLVSYVM